MILLSISLLAQAQGWAVRFEGRTADTVSFELILDATVDARGERLYVLDNRLHQVRVFNLMGQAIGTFGRRGQGPGEFEHPSRVGWQADTLWLIDGMHRVHRFSPTGQFHRTHTAIGVLAVSHDGGLLLRQQGSGLPGTPAGTRNTLEISHLSAGKLRTVFRLQQTTKPMQMRMQDGYLFLAQPFRDDAVWAVDREGRGVYLVDRQVGGNRPHTFGLFALSLSGDTLWTRRYPYQPKPLTQLMVDQRLKEIQGDTRNIPGRRLVLDPEVLVKGLYRPRYLPPVEGIVVGRDGTIWLRRETVPGSETAWYQALSSAGDPLGTIRLPATDRLVEADSNRLWIVTKDADEIPYLAWYRVTR